MNIDLILMVLAVVIFALSEGVAFCKRRYTTKGTYAYASLLFTDAVMTITATILAVFSFQNRLIGALCVLGTIAVATAVAKKSLGKSNEEILSKL